MPVRLLRTVVLVAVFAAVWLLPTAADAAPDHRSTHAQCDRTHTRNLDSNDALDDADDRDLGSDPAPTASIDGSAAVSNPDATPPWIAASRVADLRTARLIFWRELVAPRPPPSL